MNARDVSSALLQEMTGVVVGQHRLCHMLAVSLISGGHVLIEGAPGLGKTLAVRAMAKAVDAPFKRVQFTSDLMPSDILGTNVFDAEAKAFTLRKGPLFTSLLLADEINRTPPKTQSSLLEAMEEGKVTIDGQTHDLGSLFMVAATQNSIEYEGTYPLPEAQLDRFMMKLTVTYPDRAEAKRLFSNVQNGFDSHKIAEVKPVLKPEDILEARAQALEVRVDDSLLEYLLNILEATRNDPNISLGASPRAGISLLSAGKVMAACDGRDYCVPEDFRSIADAVLCHRLILTPDAEVEGLTTAAAFERALSRVPVPR